MSDRPIAELGVFLACVALSKVYHDAAGLFWLVMSAVWLFILLVEVVLSALKATAA